jgi:hypothetical protein
MIRTTTVSGPTWVDAKYGTQGLQYSENNLAFYVNTDAWYKGYSSNRELEAETPRLTMQADSHRNGRHGE